MPSGHCAHCGTVVVWNNHKLVCPKKSCPNYGKEQ